jgi:hypothetical protein
MSAKPRVHAELVDDSFDRSHLACRVWTGVDRHSRRPLTKLQSRLFLGAAMTPDLSRIENLHQSRVDLSFWRGIDRRNLPPPPPSAIRDGAKHRGLHASSRSNTGETFIPVHTITIPNCAGRLVGEGRQPLLVFVYLESVRVPLTYQRLCNDHVIAIERQ